MERGWFHETDYSERPEVPLKRSPLRGFSLKLLSESPNGGSVGLKTEIFAPTISFGE